MLFPVNVEHDIVQTGFQVFGVGGTPICSPIYDSVG